MDRFIIWGVEIARFGYMAPARLGEAAKLAGSQGRQGFADVALVGYTTAGKSTLMWALTGSDVLVANKLFATLDTTVRALHPETVSVGMQPPDQFSDCTVGQYSTGSNTR